MTRSRWLVVAATGLIMSWVFVLESPSSAETWAAASMVKSSPAAAPSETRGGGSGKPVDVKVKLRGFDTSRNYQTWINRRGGEYGCEVETRTHGVTQSSTFESTRTVDGQIYTHPKRSITILYSGLAGVAEIEREAERRYELVSNGGPGCDRPAGEVVYSGADPHFDPPTGCGRRTVELDPMDFGFSTPIARSPRSLYAHGWQPEDVFKGCDEHPYDLEALRPYPDIHPPEPERQLEALRDGRRKRLSFEFDETYGGSGEDHIGDRWSEYWEWSARVVWKATVRRD